ncbi:MAG: hypothetical protein BA869_09960 [Desulfuromonadales bacterium C00003107]|nr:MAG: hypothetical protein BA869_09960 [Desulfuromonadales bacterium C00003107]
MKVGVGVSSERISLQAGMQAAAEAVAAAGPTKLAIVAVTSNYDCAAVLAGAQSILGDIKFVGASCAGLFTPHGLFERAVGILTLSGEDISANTVLTDGRQVGAKTAGQQTGQGLLANGATSGTIIAFADSFDGRGTQLLDALYDSAGPEFSYFGGGTGDSRKFSNSFQLTEQGLFTQGVSTALIRGCKTFNTVGHGWIPTGSPLVVTRAEDRVVFELDGRAAFDVYAERLGGVSGDSFAETAMRHPLGICYGPDRFIVRDPLQIVHGNALQFISSVPNQAVAYIMKPKDDPAFTVASGLAQQALGEIAEPRFALISYCVSRSTLLGSRYKDEINSLIGPFVRQVPFLGLLASGEIGPYSGVPQFHNKSISLLMGGK